MTWQDVALVSAGAIGCAVAVIHGVLVQRLMVRPVQPLLLTGNGIGAPVSRLIPPLLHFSTFNWFVGGLALILAALWSEPAARGVAGLLVGSSYLYGAIFNFRATHGRHPGWMLYAVALALIGFGAYPFGG